jgi:hypothetical protein
MKVVQDWVAAYCQPSPFDKLRAGSAGLRELRPPNYSFRSATIGCTLAARRAGINDANSSVATVSMTASSGGLKYRWLDAENTKRSKKSQALQDDKGKVVVER